MATNRAGSNTSTFSVNVPDDLLEELNTAAEVFGVSRNKLIRQILTSGLRDGLFAKMLSEKSERIRELAADYKADPQTSEELEQTVMGRQAARSRDQIMGESAKKKAAKRKRSRSA